MTEEQPEKKLQLFDYVKGINSKDWDFYDKLTERQQKDFAPLVAMRAMSGTDLLWQIAALNEFVNPYVFNSTMSKHKKLLMMLLMVCAPGGNKRYKWINYKKKEATSKMIGVVKEYFNFSTRSAQNALPNLTNDDLLSYAEQMAYQPNQIKELKKELKKRVQD